MRALLAGLLTLLLTSCSLLPKPVGRIPLPSDGGVRTSIHHIHQETLLNSASCTATAVGPQTLLTATHCEEASDVVSVDGQDRHILKTIRDGQDHTLFILDGEPFPSALPLAPRDLLPHEGILVLGFPGGIPDLLLREGYFLRPIEFSGVKALLFELSSQPGDSGAAILSSQGEVISVVSEGDGAGHALSFPLSFTAAQLQEIR